LLFDKSCKEVDEKGWAYLKSVYDKKYLQLLFFYKRMVNSKLYFKSVICQMLVQQDILKVHGHAIYEFSHGSTSSSALAQIMLLKPFLIFM